MPRPILLLVVAIAAITGCSLKSSTSTMVARDNDNQKWNQLKADGIPITLRVPTHLKLYVYEKYFLTATNEGVKAIELPASVKDFGQDFIYSDKIIMVDFKRPGAGAFNLGVDLTKDQYISSIKQDVTDETLQRVNELVATLGIGLDASSLKTLSEIGDPIVDPKKQAVVAADVPVSEIKSVVAVGIFEIDAADFEQQVQAFLNCHINNSHDAWVVPENIDTIKRAKLSDSASRNALCGPEGNCNQTGAYCPSMPSTVHSSSQTYQTP